MKKAVFYSVVLWTQLLASAQAAEAIWQPAFADRQFAQPIAMLQPPAGDDWYVIEKAGRIWRQGPKGFQLFADLSDRIESGPGEAGLLGIAFHPQFARNRRLYLSYTIRSRPLRSVIAEYRVADGRLLMVQARPLLEVEQPYSNHNSGQLAFGPDGYLYISLGDGGAGGDPQGNGQNRNTLLGSLLRIDVDHGDPYAIPPDNPFARGGGRPEIYAYGLRNPWGWGFDRRDGKLWLADVGQDQWEEVNVIEAGGNYGWNLKEGSHCYARSPCRVAGVTDPVLEYAHGPGCSITGGRVYRGRRVPRLQGQYLYTDYCSGEVWAYDPEARGAPRRIGRLGGHPVAFAEDHGGELYLIDLGGRIYRLSGWR